MQNRDSDNEGDLELYNNNKIEASNSTTLIRVDIVIIHGDQLILLTLKIECT